MVRELTVLPAQQDDLPDLLSSALMSFGNLGKFDTMPQLFLNFNLG